MKTNKCLSSGVVKIVEPTLVIGYSSTYCIRRYLRLWDTYHTELNIR